MLAGLGAYPRWLTGTLIKCKAFIHWWSPFYHVWRQCIVEVVYRSARRVGRKYYICPTRHTPTHIHHIKDLTRYCISSGWLILTFWLCLNGRVNPIWIYFPTTVKYSSFIHVKVISWGGDILNIFYSFWRLYQFPVSSILLRPQAENNILHWKLV